MLNVFPRDPDEEPTLILRRLPAAPQVSPVLEYPPLVVSFEPEETEPLQIVLVGPEVTPVPWQTGMRQIEGHVVRRRGVGRRTTTVVTVIAAAALGFIGLLMWRTGVAAPVMPSAPPLFATVSASSLWASTTVPVKPLEVADSFNIKVASFGTESSAKTLAATLEGAGFPSFPRRNGREWLVIVGPYLSDAQTVGVRERLALQGHNSLSVFVDGRVNR